MPPRTIVIPGGGTQTLSAQLPQNLGFDVQSVVAEVDATFAPDTVPVLTVAEPSGVVIAGVPQDEPVPSGDTGLVTWALRLAGSGGGAGGALETTDGVTDVKPTKVLRILSPLNLFDFGGGTAALTATLGVEWATAQVPAAGHTNASGNLNNAAAVVPLENPQGNGVDISQAAAGKLICVVGGFYQVNVSGVAITSGAGTTSLLRILTQHSSVMGESGPLIAGSVGPVAKVSISALMRFDAGDDLRFQIGNNIAASCTVKSDLGPEFQIFRVPVF